MYNIEKQLEDRQIQIVVSASDLETVIRRIVSDEVAHIKSASKDAKITRVATLARLGKSETTLWRWEKSGYLKPIRLGKDVFYRESDIIAIEEGRK